MKFRLKLTLAMLCLLSLLFAAGGAALISISFRTALEREEESARAAGRLLLETLQVIGGIERWEDEQSAADALGQMTAQESFPAVRFFSEDALLYAQGAAASDFLDLTGQTGTGQMTVAYFSDHADTPYLQVTTCLQLGAKPLYLSLGQDLSGIYETRDLQQRAYRLVFALMLVLGTLLSYLMAALLTRPLNKLSRASREIAAGNLAYRSKLQSRDELGALSRDFDAMAGQVERSVLALRDAARRQEQFMGSFTHELKTPMTSIIGYADLLRGQSLNAKEQAEAANYIFSEGRRLENLCLKLLDIFVADKRTLDFKPVSPAELAQSVAAQLKPGYAEARVRIHCEGEAGRCLLDPDLTRTLLLNLLENAKKSMDGGGQIHLSAYLLADGCRFVISDSGRGIPPEALAHITEAFYRVDKSRSRTQGNAGLGLALCAKIAELHHGSMEFDSTPGLGTTVVAELRGGRA